jgi:hypothetical protein
VNEIVQPNKKAAPPSSKQPGYLLLPQGDPWLSVPASRRVWLFYWDFIIRTECILLTIGELLKFIGKSLVEWQEYYYICWIP